MTGFIDVHAHFLTGSYVAQARAAGHDVPTACPRGRTGRRLRTWS
jgi:hypothetical protein